MPITIIDDGHNNQIDAPREFLEEQVGTIFFERSHNHVVIGAGSNGTHFYLHCGSDATIHVGDQVRIAAAQIHIVAPAKLIIAEFTAFVGSVRIAAHEPADITFGHNCLIADDVLVSASDMHSVVDAATGERLNHAQPIVIGHRVWIGARSTVLKGTTVGDGTVIGAHSLVRGTIPGNVLAAGVPAKVLRTGVTWRTEMI